MTSSRSSTSSKSSLGSGYRKLIVWQEAKQLTVLVYKLTENLPQSEEFGLKSQMRRASVSIMSNIAEGWIRKSKKDKLRYLEISEGSLFELESEGEIVLAVGYWTKGDYLRFDKQRAKTSFLLYRYKNSINI
ncbi:four helix bundle protein [Patescibacteria group bacterium]